MMIIKMISAIQRDYSIHYEGTLKGKSLFMYIDLFKSNAKSITSSFIVCLIYNCLVDVCTISQQHRTHAMEPHNIYHIGYDRFLIKCNIVLRLYLRSLLFTRCVQCEMLVNIGSLAKG